MSRWAELEAKYGAGTANLGPMSRGAWRLYWEAMEATEAEYLTHFNAGVPMPETITPRAALIERANAARKAVKQLAADVLLAKSILQSDIAKSPAMFIAGAASETLPHDISETMANLTLAYRHLEDASMRLGKSIQSADGGVSVYDRETTVGA